MLSQYLRPIQIFLFVFLGAVQLSFSSSLKANIGEILLSNLQVGQSYNLKEILKVPYQVTYTEGADAEIIIETVVPKGDNELKPGFESIPDASWMSVSPENFDVGTGGIMDAELILTIPDDDAYLGKKYIIYVWARTKNKMGGLSYGLGVKSRFLLAINTIRLPEEEASKHGAESISINFGITPQEVTSRFKLKPGKKYSLKKLVGKNVLVQNNEEKNQYFKLKAVLGKDYAMTPLPGWEWPPNTEAVTFKSDRVFVKAKKSAPLKAVFQIPKSPEYKGKKFFYIIRVSPDTKGATSGVLSRILLEVAD